MDHRHRASKIVKVPEHMHSLFRYCAYKDSRRTMHAWRPSHCLFLDASVFRVLREWLGGYQAQLIFSMFWLGDPPSFGHQGKYSCFCTPALFFGSAYQWLPWLGFFSLVWFNLRFWFVLWFWLQTERALPVTQAGSLEFDNRAWGQSSS